MSRAFERLDVAPQPCFLPNAPFFLLPLPACSHLREYAECVRESVEMMAAFSRLGRREDIVAVKALLSSAGARRAPASFPAALPRTQVRARDAAASAARASVSSASGMMFSSSVAAGSGSPAPFPVDCFDAIGAASTLFNTLSTPKKIAFNLDRAMPACPPDAPPQRVLSAMRYLARGLGFDVVARSTPRIAATFQLGANPRMRISHYRQSHASSIGGGNEGVGALLLPTSHVRVDVLGGGDAHRDPPTVARVSRPLRASASARLAVSGAAISRNDSSPAGRAGAGPFAGVPAPRKARSKAVHVAARCGPVFVLDFRLILIRASESYLINIVLNI